MITKISLVVIASIAIAASCKKTVHPEDQYDKKVDSYKSILYSHPWRFNSINYRKNGTNEYLTPPLRSCYNGIKITYSPDDMFFWPGPEKCLPNQVSYTRASFKVGGNDYKNPASADSLKSCDEPDFSTIWTPEKNTRWFKIETINQNELYISRVTGDTTIYERYIPF